MSDSLKRADMSVWLEVTQLRKYVTKSVKLQRERGWSFAHDVKLISGYPGVRRACWRVWLAEAYPITVLDGDPMEEVLAFAEIREAKR